MRVLVTRPESQSRSFAGALAEHGHETVLAPMLRFDPRPPPDDLAERLAAAQAILLTSANGARALAGAVRVRGYRLIAVGDATQRAARRLGFTDVASAGGDSAALVAFVSRQLKPTDGPLVHVGGGAPAGDVAAALRASKFRVEDIALYDMRPIDALPNDVMQAIQSGGLGAVTFFSPRTAQAFVKVTVQAGLAPYLAGTAAVGISPAALAGADGIPWRTRIAARAPTQDSVLAALDALAPPKTGSPPMSDTSKPTTSDAPSGEAADVTTATDTAATPERAESATPAPAPPRRRGVGVIGAFICGLAASVVVLGGAVAVYMANPEAIRNLVRPAAEDAGSAPVSRQMLAGSLEPLDERLTQLEAKARALDAVAAQAAQLKDLQDKLAAQESRLAALRELSAKVDTLPKGGDPQAASRLANELAQARRDLTALRSELASLKTRQETAETTIRTLTERPAAMPAPGTTGSTDVPADVARQIAVLQDRLDRLEKRDAQVSGALTGAIDSAALARAISEAEARLRDQMARQGADIERARETAAKLAERIGAVEQEVATKVDSLGKDIAAVGEAGRRASEKDRGAAAIGIAVRLRRAIDAGGPFAAEADLLKPLAAGDPAVAAIHTALAPYAAAGVATRRALAHDFAEVARQVLAADRADDSWGERVLGKLRQLVSIRRVGEDTQGSTPEAILARAEAAVEGGDLVKAVNEMKALKSPADAPARDWLRRAEAHLAAQQAVDRLSLHGIALLSHAPAK